MYITRKTWCKQGDDTHIKTCSFSYYLLNQLILIFGTRCSLVSYSSPGGNKGNYSTSLTQSFPEGSIIPSNPLRIIDRYKKELGMGSTKVFSWIKVLILTDLGC